MCSSDLHGYKPYKVSQVLSRRFGDCKDKASLMQAMLKVAGVDGAAPALEWVNELAMGTGGNVNSIDLDAAGNPYVSLDFRGATTRFAAARFSPAGALTWAKQWDPNNAGDNNNTYVVRVAGDQVLVGGRIAFQPFDTQFGEGFVMNLTTDGAWKWGSFYYTGKGTEEICEHRVKGFALAGDELLVDRKSVV